MDDRILLVPPIWSPDIRAAAETASVRALVERLEAFLPLDEFSGPTLKGAKWPGEGVQRLVHALREHVRPEHHIVDLSTCPESLFVVLAEQPARSLTIPGFYPSPATARAAGDEGLASGLMAAHAVVIQGPSQMFPSLMEGADRRMVETIVRKLEAGLDKQALTELTTDFMETDFLGKARVELPVFVLDPATNVPAAGADLVRRFADNVRTGQLEGWGLRMQEEEGGIELADKAIDFIRQVIARREATAQT